MNTSHDLRNVWEFLFDRSNVSFAVLLGFIAANMTNIMSIPALNQSGAGCDEYHNPLSHLRILQSTRAQINEATQWPVLAAV